jgi:hypothetical protein
VHACHPRHIRGHNEASAAALSLTPSSCSHLCGGKNEHLEDPWNLAFFIFILEDYSLSKVVHFTFASAAQVIQLVWFVSWILLFSAYCIQQL